MSRGGASKADSSCLWEACAPAHSGSGMGPAGDKFRVSGTQETVGGAGASKASGVLEEANPLTASGADAA